MSKVKVLFVCMGNICRSPTAEGVFHKLVKDQSLDDTISVDSAGTHAYHVGESPDRRAQASAKNRGIDLSIQVARQFVASDYEEFDYILAMDNSNLLDMQALNSGNGKAKLSLFLDYSPISTKIKEVPDPYYGGERGFENVLDLIESASIGLLDDIKANHL